MYYMVIDVVFKVAKYHLELEDRMVSKKYFTLWMILCRLLLYLCFDLMN
jgi:hypothetical protein